MTHTTPMFAPRVSMILSQIKCAQFARMRGDILTARHFIDTARCNFAMLCMDTEPPTVRSPGR